MLCGLSGRKSGGGGGARDNKAVGPGPSRPLRAPEKTVYGRAIHTWLTQQSPGASPMHICPFQCCWHNTPTILTAGNDPTQLKTRSQANQQCNPGYFLKGNLIRTREKHKSRSVKTTHRHQSARLLSALNYATIKPPTWMKSTPKLPSAITARHATAGVFLHRPRAAT